MTYMGNYRFQTGFIFISVEKGDSSESLLLPSASASAELVECRTEALLCTKVCLLCD